MGNIPVPYSGDIAPDEHPNHTGAWPADVYYGDMDGTWTDQSANYQQTVNSDPADRARLSNTPGDGKFDQTTPPSAVELQVGRVDLAGMPGRTYPWNESAREKIGRYKDTSTKATKIPMQIMMAGSTRLRIAVTRVETSSS